MQHVTIHNKQYNLVTIDFETYYDKDYTLKKMSTTLYICDPCFLIHGVSVIYKGKNNYYYHNEQKSLDSLKETLNEIDWKNSALLAHHTHFDGLILSRYFGIIPAYYLDTLSMSRPILQNRIKRLDLDSIAKYYRIGGKLPGLEDTKGKRELTVKEAVRLGIYCKNDTDMTIKVFERLLPEFTEQELDIIHLTVKMYADPKLEVDEEKIDEEIKQIRTSKTKMFDAVKSIFPKEYKDIEVRKVLCSSEMLATTMRHNNVIPPTKISPTTNKETYAFAKTDLNFQALQDLPNPAGKLLYEARITAKSDTALNKVLHLKQNAEYKCCPAYLNYWRAITGRWSGCVTPDHEVLTKQGWININKWNGEEIEIWDPETKSLFFETPKQMNVFEYNGTLNKYKSNYINFTVTDDHKIPINSKQDDKVDKRFANDLCNINSETFISGKHNSTNSTHEDYLKLHIAFQANGNFDRKAIKNNPDNINGVIFKFKKQRKINRLEELLHKLSIPFIKTISKCKNTCFYISIKYIPSWISKNFSWSWINLNSYYQEIILSEVLFWEGYVNNRKSYTRKKYFTTNKQNADIVQTLAHLNNCRALITKPKLQTYKVNWASNITNGYLQKNKWSKIKYKGKVYCPTTSTGYWLVRKNSTISITCNSDKIQLQNLPRGGKARQSILAPKGHYLLVCDLSQIELRMSAWFSNQKDVIKIFESGKDVYLDMAAKIYNKNYEDFTKSSSERMVAKVAVLGLGYGCGVDKFGHILKSGIMGPKLDLPKNEIKRIHTVYRTSNNHIVNTWKKANIWLSSMAVNIKTPDVHYKGLTFTREKVIMPGNNIPLIYPNLAIDEDGNFSFQGTNANKRRIYSSLFYENLIQALSRNVIAEQMTNIAKYYDIMFCVHDEIIIAVPEDEIEYATQLLLKIMTTSPAWCSDLKLDAEAGYAREYSK